MITVNEHGYVTSTDQMLHQFLRPEVIEMAIAMEEKLRKNDHKTGWKDQPIQAHIRYLEIEKMEFDLALEFLTFEEACKELVDMANFCLIIRNKLITQGKEAFVSRPDCDAPIKDSLVGYKP